MTKIVKFASLPLLMFLGLPMISNADSGGLNPCKDSEVFQKRLAKTVKKLENRLKKYE